MTLKNKPNIFLTVTPEQKAKFVRAASMTPHGTLNDWLVSLAEQELTKIKLPKPKWMKGLSDRASDSLLSADIVKLETLEQLLDTDEGRAKLLSLNNFCSKCLSEVEDWLLYKRINQ